MRTEQSKIVIDNFSLSYLFDKLKKSNDNSTIGEIYSKTYDHVFNYVYPKISAEKDAFDIVQNVYRQLSVSHLNNVQEQSLLSYLERLADGLLILCTKYSNVVEQNSFTNKLAI